MADRSRCNRASAPRASPAEPRPHEYINAPEQVVLRYSIIEPERIEQASLISIQPPHHRRLEAGDPWNQRNHCSATFSSLFRQHRSKPEILTTSKCFPVYPELRTSASIIGMSQLCE